MIEKCELRREPYVSPSIESLFAEVEQGFAGSNSAGGGKGGDFGEIGDEGGASPSCEEWGYETF